MWAFSHLMVWQCDAFHPKHLLWGITEVDLECSGSPCSIWPLLWQELQARPLDGLLHEEDGDEEAKELSAQAGEPAGDRSL